ncbi:hypothetical protein IAT38_008097 [Cryptococcus sp. DSM 104549]
MAASPTSSPPLEAIVDSIVSYPEARESSGPHLSATDPSNDDVPGPSTTYIPRQPSPPLPNLKTKSFPAVDASSDEEDSDDEVLATLPIYLAPVAAPGLDVYQYPLQHRSLSVPTWARDRGKYISARVKEKVGRVEVEIPVDAGADYWRDERATELGYTMDVENGDGPVGGYGFGGADTQRKGAKEKAKKSEKWGDKMRLTSEPLPNATGYYSGVVRDGALHLHPIKNTLQFRTSLGYLDDLDAPRGSRRGADEDEDAAKKKGKAPVGSATRPGQRKALDEEDNDGSGSIKDFRNKMWYMKQKEDEDVWVGYSWKAGVEDDAVAEALDALVVPEDKRERLVCRTKGLDYLDRS